MTDQFRKTAISWAGPDKVLIRGYRVEELMGSISWGKMVYLLLLGELPDERLSRMIEAILVSVSDHGPTPPSTLAAVTVANTGASLSAAVAAGILAIARSHGAAIEDAMNVFEQCMQLRQKERSSPVEAAEKVVAQFQKLGQRVPGFGHRFHQTDPRASRLFRLSEELGLSASYVEQAEILERVLSASAGHHLPINADGAIAALLCEMDFPSRLANGLFIIARVVGLIAHVCEEQDRNKPMHTVDSQGYEYDGPAERSLGSAGPAR